MELRYTAEHEWVAAVDGTATVGITEHAQAQLGDLVFVQMPEVGSTVRRGGVAGVVESVKAASDLFAPVSGRVLEINTAVLREPALVNTDPLGAGWLFKVAMSEPVELDQLLDDTAYRALK